jgi:hypothetical protein
VTLATETGNQDFIVDFDKIQATVIGDKGSDLLAGTSELDTDTLTNGRVRLFRFDTAKRRETFRIGNLKFELGSVKNIVCVCVCKSETTIIKFPELFTSGIRCPYSYLHHFCTHTHARTKKERKTKRIEYLQLFQNNSLSVRSTTERLNLVGSTEGTLLVSLIGPTLGAAFSAELASCVKSSGLAFG